MPTVASQEPALSKDANPIEAEAEGNLETAMTSQESSAIMPSKFQLRSRGERQAVANKNEDASSQNPSKDPERDGVEQALKAVAAGDAEQLRKIVEANPFVKTKKVNMRDGLGERGIFLLATQNDEVACSTYLAEAGCDIHEVWVPPHGGRAYTPLGLAILCRTISVRDRMFQALMRVATREIGQNAAGWKIAMGAAATMGDARAMRDIWLHLGPEARRLWGQDIDSDGHLLHKIAGGGSMEALAMAWSWDGVANRRGDKNAGGMTPTDIAARGRHVEMARELKLRAIALDEASALSAAAGTAEKGGWGGRRI